MISVVSLLRAAWIAGTLPIVIASIPSPKLNAFHELIIGFARRGKIMQSSSKKFSVPQKFFCHFYILAVVWTTFLLVATSLYAHRTAPTFSEPVLYSSIASHLTGVSHELSLHKSHSSLRDNNYKIWKSIFLLLLMETQVLGRLFESIYVFKYSPAARMHIFGYLTGLFSFLGVGFINAVAMLFLACYANNILVSENQGSLRDNDEKVDDYAIPRGDWFEYVSSPHYLAEIVIYGGLVVASGFSDITIWLLFGFVVANLVFAAAETQRWYIRKFDNYPRNRYAVFPFVYCR
ncbi:UNVERIFIED_CONTAM: Polyprenol reductase 2 [Sesamum radiatum]|uniref:Polyprenol reductase 2 n=1 Tax=Sesamum radiatum TaxID=300843 RepID=A0AAW2MU13_SESRA